MRLDPEARDDQWRDCYLFLKFRRGLRLFGFFEKMNGCVAC